MKGGVIVSRMLALREAIDGGRASPEAAQAYADLGERGAELLNGIGDETPQDVALERAKAARTLVAEFLDNMPVVRADPE